MRHKPETEEMTRFLIQKPIAYAELEENSRIALSVLTDGGWSMSRIDMDMQVRVSATATIQHIDQREQQDQHAALVRELEQAQAQFIVLRAEVAGNAADQWLAIAMGCIVCGVVSWLGHNFIVDMAFAVVAVGIWRGGRAMSRRKAEA